MPKAEHKNFDLDRVLEILRKGVRRADVFLGVGLNAASHDPRLSHLLVPDNFMHIHLVKQQLTDEEKVHVADEFDKWIRANGLRDLIETFSIFLHRLYVPLYQIEASRRPESLDLATPERFEQKGISDQVEDFARLVPVSAEDIQILKSLNQARNCYAHRRGIIGKRDVDADVNTFTLLWKTLQIRIEEPDGNVVVGRDLQGKTFEQGGVMQLQNTLQEKVFSLNEELLLDRREMKEICLSVYILGKQFFRGTIDYAREAGVLREIVNESTDEAKPV